MMRTKESSRKYANDGFQVSLTKCARVFTVCSKKGATVHKVLAANKNARALGSDRRDEMRYALRAKIS